LHLRDTMTAFCCISGHRVRRAFSCSGKRAFGSGHRGDALRATRTHMDRKARAELCTYWLFLLEPIDTPCPRAEAPRRKTGARGGASVAGSPSNNYGRLPSKTYSQGSYTKCISTLCTYFQRAYRANQLSYVILCPSKSSDFKNNGVIDSSHVPAPKRVEQRAAAGVPCRPRRVDLANLSAQTT